MNSKFINKVRQLFILNSTLLTLFSSCSTQKQIHQSAKTDVLASKALETAHVGISIFDPSTNKYLYNYQGDRYFVPASNTKIPTCYAAMKYLGDSLVGLKYGFPEEKMYANSLLVIQPTGDPTLLHKDYNKQPIFDFLKKELIIKNKIVGAMDTVWKDEHFGNGWSWNDYDAAYMTEKSSFPVYGNVVTVSIKDSKEDNSIGYKGEKKFISIPEYFDSLINESWKGEYFDNNRFSINREISANKFSFTKGSATFKNQTIPFVTNSEITAFNVFNKTFGKQAFICINIWPTEENRKFSYDCPNCDFDIITINDWNKIHSQPTDSVLKPMMHRSDNFFAEQMLLMVSNEMLGVMNDAKIIDTILKTDFKDLPQKPRWVDGSGLSRYNLFSPQDFVAILNKMKNEFGMDRIKEIFPTGGEGTISSYYKNEKGFIYGKTGTLSGVVAFSGFLYTKKGKLLIFSTLVNNHNDSATAVRRAIEKFLIGVRDKY